MGRVVGFLLVTASVSPELCCRDARCRAGLTQAALAERAGVVRPLISQYETGKKDPSVTMLARLIDACGMELRMLAAELTDADRGQYVRDAVVGEAQGRRTRRDCAGMWCRSAVLLLRRWRG